MPQPSTGPLFTESTVELYRRARQARGKPAPPDARAVGALYQLILAIHAAEPVWRAAADKTTDDRWRHTLDSERETRRRHAYQAAGIIRELGGLPPEMRDRAELPHDVRDIEYAGSEDDVRRCVEEDRERIEQAVLRAEEELGAYARSIA